MSWPGRGVGNHRQPYIKVRFGHNPNVNAPFETHIIDSHTGTHLVPPAYALPSKGFDNSSYSAEVRQWLAEYEKKHGPRGTSDVTTEKVPIEQTCGRARVIDVTRNVPDLNSQFGGGVWDYISGAKWALARSLPDYPFFRGVMTGWDNTPRLPHNGQIFVNAHPANSERWLTGVIAQTRARH